MSTDAEILTRWVGRLRLRQALLITARARLKVKPNSPKAVALVKRRKAQVAEAERVIGRHSTGSHVSAPVDPILGDTWGWHPGVHDGVDLIAAFDDTVVAICDGIIVDARSSGWWGKGAQASSGHPISDGDGIIQLKCTTHVGPFKPGLVFGYGHTEHAIVKVGQAVKAGQRIGRIGFANAGHIHFMVNDGTKRRGDGGYSGVGDHDPLPYVNYARSHS
jgi:murein DD-endopeptidase MepM/ murein hydrolase activator NlpD